MAFVVNLWMVESFRVCAVAAMLITQLGRCHVTNSYSIELQLLPRRARVAYVKETHHALVAMPETAGTASVPLLTILCRCTLN